MLDLDQRVVDGLHELAGRAPVDAEVWPQAGKHVAKRRRARRAVAGGAMVLVLFVGGLTAIGLTRSGGSKAVVASHQAFPTVSITAAPTGGLTFAPASITLQTGLYDLTLTDGTNAQHTLYFDDPATLWPGVTVNDLGEAKTARVFFGAAGDYTFYCAVPGHRAAGMQGVIHVTGDTITLAQAEGEPGSR